MTTKTELEHLGGGWYLLPDGRKIQGYDRARKTAGLDRKPKPKKTSGQVRHEETAKTNEIDERRAKVAELLVRKTPYRKIASALGISLGTVASDVESIRTGWREEALGDVSDAVIEELRSLDADEFDLRLAYERARDPDLRLRIYDRIARIRERRVKLLGLDAPTVARILGAGDGPSGGEHLVFRAGGDETDFVDAMKAAQGQGDRKLRLVSDR